MTTDIRIRKDKAHRVMISGESLLGNNWMFANLLLDPNSANKDAFDNYVTMRPEEGIEEIIEEMKRAGLEVDYK